MSGKWTVVVLFIGLIGLGLAAPGAGAESWGEQFPISVPAQNDQGVQNSTVVADEQGNFTYIWAQALENGGQSILSRVLTADGTLRETRTVATSDLEGDPVGGAASVGADGIVRVAWLRTKTVGCPGSCQTRYRIEFNTLNPDGSPDGAASVVEQTAFEEFDFLSRPVIGTDARNETNIAWSYYDNSTNSLGINTARVLEGGNPLAPFTIESAWSQLYDVELAISPDGTTFFGWHGVENIGEDYRVEGRVLRPDGFLTPAVTLMTSPPSRPIYATRSTIDDQGKATVAFVVADGPDDDISYRQVSANGSLVGPGPTLLSQDTPFRADEVALDAAADGSVLATFTQEQPPAPTGVWSRVIPPTGPPGTVRLLSDPTKDSSGAETAALSVGGGATIFKTLDLASGNWTIHGARLKADGSLDGTRTPLASVNGSFDMNDIYASGITASGSGEAGAIWSPYISAADGELELNSAIFDGAKPEVTLWSAPRATVDQEIVIGALATDRNHLTYQWSFGDGTSANTTTPFIKHTFTEAGNRTIGLTVTDAADNEASVQAPIAVIRNEPPVPPNTKITGKPAKKTKKKTATFRFISSLSGSKFECRLDRAGWTSCKSSRKLKKLKKGKHTFRVRAIKGNLIDSTPASYGWTVKKPRKKK